MQCRVYITILLTIILIEYLTLANHFYFYFVHHLTMYYCGLWFYIYLTKDKSKEKLKPLNHMLNCIYKKPLVYFYQPLSNIDIYKVLSLLIDLYKF